MALDEEAQTDGSDAAPDGMSAAIESVLSHWATAVRYAARRCNLNEAELDDLTQDVRLRIWRVLQRSNGDPSSIAASYARRTTMSAAIDLLRRRRASHGNHMRISLDDAGDIAATPLTSAHEEDEMIEALDTALAALPEDRRVAVRLHLSGRDLSEIAATTGWSSARARNLLYRGLADVKRALMQNAEHQP